MLKRLMIVALTTILILVGSAPPAYASGVSTGVVLVNVGSTWRPAVVGATRFFEDRTSASFRVVESCNPTRTRRCVFVRLDSTYLQSRGLAGMASSDDSRNWRVLLNTRMALAAYPRARYNLTIHEFGHVMNLLHHSDRSNRMYPGVSRSTQYLTAGQLAIIRRS